MEWVETTAKSIEEAKHMALDQLGVAADEAEFDVVDEPKSGLFGRVRGEARVRARVRPTQVRPKQERRPRGRKDKREGAGKGSDPSKQDAATSGSSDQSNGTGGSGGSDASTRSDAPSTEPRNERSKQPKQKKEHSPMSNDRQQSDVTPQQVGDAAVAFMSDLAGAFGIDDVQADLTVDGTDLEVRLTGSELGLMVGPGGRTLNAVQDLVRVASQRRLGDHETRLRVDVGGYREKRREALEKFASTVAAQVLETGEAKALEPMPSSDRKAVHDAIIEIDGVTSRSDGDDPMRRVVIAPE